MAGSAFFWYQCFIMQKIMRRKIIFPCVALLAVFPLYAEPDVKSDTSLALTVSSLPEAKLTLAQSFTLPFLRGEHFLVENNNVKFGLDAELSPVSMNLKGDAVITPAAFFQLAAGGMIGSGWNIELFGGEVRGIGKNVRAADGSTSADASPLDGVFAEGHFGGALQFDIAALFPGDWNHVVFRSYHEIGYKAYSRAAKGEAWFFENDFGENQNGWNYYGNYLAGYQMPIFLNTVALLAEMRKYLYGSPGGGQWGDALGRWEFSAIMNFAVTKSFSAALITQFRTLRRYSDYSYGDDFDLFYQDRHLADGSSRRLSFYRVAAVMQYRFGAGD